MEVLLANNPDVQTRIIFSATNEDADIKSPPIRHLQAIAEIGEQQLTKQALNNWYLSEKKVYEVFAAKYTMK